MYSCPNDKHCTVLDYFMQLCFNNMCEINTLISKVITFFFYCFENPKGRVYLLKKFQITQYYVKQEVKGAPSPHVACRSALWSARGLV